ncbi:MAG TPA: DNA topoisomerase VI subunit B [Tepidisphaeraceae bacterium]|jgi:DNA topoisomerase-6 subunit B|nr:DNA topoisomerase VI subunit B [Tepidisphaeraceae bacterium]
MAKRQKAKVNNMTLRDTDVATADSSTSTPKNKRKRETAETMAAKQKDISVSEFFAKNRHLLGFDNPRKALLTTVKEAVDNSLDACEEAGSLPNVTVIIEDLQPDRLATAKQSRYRVTIVDNGPGIVRKQVENVFGRLLFGSKFHRLKMSRGQQGIGISAAGMYGLITTGKPMVIHTLTDPKKMAHHIELAMNTKTNRAEVTVDQVTKEFPPHRLKSISAGTRDPGFLNTEDYETGTSVSIELEGRYQKGRGSVDEFLELVAIANPHARITFVPPTRVAADDSQDDLPLTNAAKDSLHVSGGAAASVGISSESAVAGVDPTITTIEKDGVIFFPRGTDALPPETQEIQPHPKGIELGILIQMMKDYESHHTRGGTLFHFLQEKFCRVSAGKASEFCKEIGVHSRTKVCDLEPQQIENLFKHFQEARLPSPPTDCLAPIGVRQLLAGMLKGVKAEFYAASSREPDIYRGRPFQIEAAIAFGGELPADASARVIRFANRVPLLFQQSACSSFQAVTETGWRNYNLSQPRGSLPVGPLVIMIHMASVWVPFTSESKEAIADYDEIRKEMKLALMECGRKLGTYLRKRQKMERESARRDIFERYIGEISKAVNSINSKWKTQELYDALLKEARKRTAIADAQLDEEGKVKKQDETEELKHDAGVVMVESRATHLIEAQQQSEEPVSIAKPPASKTKAKKSKKKSSDNGGNLFE